MKIPIKKYLRNTDWRKTHLPKSLPISLIIATLCINWNSLKALSNITNSQFINDFVIASMIFGLFIVIIQVVSAPNWISSFFPFIILLITIFSFYAFGVVEVETIKGEYLPKLNLPGLATILVLFFLSELAVGLTGQVQKVKKENEAIQKRLKEIADDITQSDFSDLIRVLPYLTSTTTETFKLIAEESSSKKILGSLTKFYNSWLKLFGRLKNQENRDEKMHLWQLLLETYIKEECLDIDTGTQLKIPVKEEEPPFTIKEERFQVPTIATTDRYYLKLLHRLAEGMITHFKDKFKNENEFKICFFAFTVVAPEYWYNWKHDHKKYALDAHNEFRNIIKRIVHEHGSRIEYKRIVFFDKERKYKNRGIEKFPNKLDEQKKKVFVTLEPDEEALKVEDWPITDFEILRDIVRWKNPSLKIIKGPNKKMYFIINENELSYIGHDPNNYHNITTDSSSKASRRLKCQNLILKFVEELHSSFNDAFYAILQSGDLEKLYIEDQDLLMVGFKKSEDVNPTWLMSVSTNLRPGYETMSMRVSTRKEILQHLYDFFVKLKKEKRIYKWIDIPEIKKIYEQSENRTT